MQKINDQEYLRQLRALERRLRTTRNWLRTLEKHTLHEASSENQETASIRSPARLVVEELHQVAEELTTQGEALLESFQSVMQERNRITEVFDLVPDGFLVTDPHGVIQEANQTASTLLHIQPRFLVGKPLMNFVYLEDRPALRQHLVLLAQPFTNAAASFEPPQIQIQIRLTARDQSIFPASVRFSGVYTATRKITSVRWLIHDISRYVQAEEECYRLLMETIQDYAVFLMDEEARILTWNRGAEQLFGYSAVESIGNPAAVLLDVPPEEAYQAFRTDGAQADAQGSIPQRGWYRRKDGSQFFAEGMLSGVFFRGRARWVMVLQDATRRKQNEDLQEAIRRELEHRVAARTMELEQINARLHSEIQQRQQAMQELQRATEAREELMLRLVNAQEDERRRISRELHDQLGQHLSAFSLGVKSLEDTLGPEAARSEDSLAYLRFVGEELSKDIHRLAWELRPTALDDLGLNRTLENYVELWSNRTGMTAEFQAIFPPGARPPRLPASVETTLYRIVQEALNNVLKHAHATHVSVILNIQPRTVALIVEDNGRGFEVNSVPQPSREFLHQQENLMGTDESGLPRSGLGLLSIQERARMVGGSLTIESTPPDGGTSLYIKIPLP